jgi:hypothetical protein
LVVRFRGFEEKIDCLLEFQTFCWGLQYTEPLRQFIHSMLASNPKHRPSAETALKVLTKLVSLRNFSDAILAILFRMRYLKLQELNSIKNISTLADICLLVQIPSTPQNYQVFSFLT